MANTKGELTVTGVNHSYGTGKLRVPVLFDINLHINRGEFVALCGSSGSGKSTLLNLLAGLTKPEEGSVTVSGEEISKFSENQLCLFRRKNMGFIFQSYNLLPNLTALENVELPLIFAGESVKKRRAKATEILNRVGLDGRIHHRPNELSGGQQQRVSIARALVNQPDIILADEPTGNLDSKTEQEILHLMREMNKENGTTFIIVTHEQEVAEQSDRVIYLQDGRVVQKRTRPA
ncbi:MULTISPECIES: ABC transporter ATP-binding protein [Brevibacillus]|jgi:putative ABC transport system ATP-binding protein|uniref:Peptide ABC transporter ATP-binding protein n=1 Tax=Brevibacillus parabrevis TaxID=54914 RepID=A0A4Y3PS33_BREPA|nr:MULTISPECIES: ABC transporter ATP-binding protein [Brevibacillus]MBU8711745.1 ABC transporter ATP-binding protein [Brevibacillus parabrevis]MDH6349626.1 putative ABC transport system ATP-binding protein [Brevibacillus sp. 1238]MDR4999081.1 ABC transporter ATP-binding protein [Brevibacillus parabrevis]MED2254362.1 ABC transporter ATP-binding protein [Brevibacillus parabrevis]NRQ54621.1 ABC transporter ATP-binding protein [Brevibacillus sp. HD1.4A]